MALVLENGIWKLEADSVWDLCTDIDFTAEDFFDFTASNKVIDGLTWSLENKSTVATCEIDSGGLGLHLLVNNTNTAYNPTVLGAIGFPMSELNLPYGTQVSIQAVTSISTLSVASTWYGGIHAAESDRSFGVMEELGTSYQYGRVARSLSGVFAPSSLLAQNVEYTYWELTLGASGTDARAVFNTDTTIGRPGTVSSLNAPTQEYMANTKRPADGPMLDYSAARIAMFGLDSGTNNVSMYLERLIIRCRPAV